jgi:hypothetical protein
MKKDEQRDEDTEHEEDIEHEDDPPRRRPRLTRNERLQGLADRGCDTWEEYRGER